LNRNDCCSEGDVPQCNVYWYLAPPLAQVGHLQLWSFAAASAPALHAEIDAGRPLCIRSARADGGAHFLAIIGYLPGSAGVAGSELIAVEDPWWGPSDVPLDVLLSGYKAGDWTDSIYTE
jgi:hypothetical protein